MTSDLNTPQKTQKPDLNNLDTQVLSLSADQVKGTNFKAL